MFKLGIKGAKKSSQKPSLGLLIDKDMCVYNYDIRMVRSVMSRGLWIMQNG